MASDEVGHIETSLLSSNDTSAIPLAMTSEELYHSPSNFEDNQINSTVNYNSPLEKIQYFYNNTSIGMLLYRNQIDNFD